VLIFLLDPCSRQRPDISEPNCYSYLQNSSSGCIVGTGGRLNFYFECCHEKASIRLKIGLEPQLFNADSRNVFTFKDQVTASFKT
jgi:hypothetical protein